MFVEASGSIYKSSNNGQSWVNCLNIDWQSSTYNHLTTDFYNRIYASSPNGVFVSIDNGTTWSQKINGLINTNVL